MTGARIYIPHLIKALKTATYLTNMKANEQEQIAIYRIMTDAYKQKFKVRTRLFYKLLSHMMQKLGSDTTIFYLMDSMIEIRKQNN